MKQEKIQKKKTDTIRFFDILFKILVVFAIIIFSYIAITKIDFSTGKMDFNSPKKSTQADAPSQLKWFDHFKGVENVPSKKQKEDKSKGENGSTGFKYQGFGK